MKTYTETDNEFVCDIQAPCFKLLTQEEAELIKSSKTQVFFRKGEIITKQGAFASYILFVISGYAKQYIEDESTKNYGIRIIQAGEFLGLSAVFNQNIFTYSVQALTDTKVFLINKEAIISLIKQNGQFAFSLINRYSSQSVFLFESIKNLTFKQMNGRLAATLLYLSSVNTVNDNIFNYLSRRDIADFAGMAVESAVKLLKQFEKDGIIKLTDKDISVIDKNLLTEISKRG